MMKLVGPTSPFHLKSRNRSGWYKYQYHRASICCYLENNLSWLLRNPNPNLFRPWWARENYVFERKNRRSCV